MKIYRDQFRKTLKDRKHLHPNYIREFTNKSNAWGFFVLFQTSDGITIRRSYSEPGDAHCAILPRAKSGKNQEAPAITFITDGKVNYLDKSSNVFLRLTPDVKADSDHVGPFVIITEEPSTYFCIRSQLEESFKVTGDITSLTAGELFTPKATKSHVFVTKGSISTDDKVWGAETLIEREDMPKFFSVDEDTVLVEFKKGHKVDWAAV